MIPITDAEREAEGARVDAYLATLPEIIGDFAPGTPAGLLNNEYDAETVLIAGKMDPIPHAQHAIQVAQMSRYMSNDWRIADQVMQTA